MIWIYHPTAVRLGRKGAGCGAFGDRAIGNGCPSIYDGTYSGELHYDSVSDTTARLSIHHTMATDPFFGCNLAGGNIISAKPDPKGHSWYAFGPGAAGFPSDQRLAVHYYYWSFARP